MGRFCICFYYGQAGDRLSIAFCVRYSQSHNFRTLTFSISLSMIRFSAIINLWGEGNRTSRSGDFMYFKESTVRKPLLSNSPARRSSSSALETEQSHWYTSLFGAAIMARKSEKWLKDERQFLYLNAHRRLHTSVTAVKTCQAWKFNSRKKDNKLRLNSILLHCNNEAPKVFCTYIWCFYKIFIRKKISNNAHLQNLFFIF